MWARVSTYDGSPDDIDGATTYAQEKILPQLRDVPGYRGLYALADRDSGRTMSITLWHDEAAMRASEADADRMRDDSAQHAGGTVESIERFEVTFDDLV